MSATADWDALLAELHAIRTTLELVRKLRMAQREYFATRDKEKLRHCKALEKRLDEMLNISPDTQQALFSHEPKH